MEPTPPAGPPTVRLQLPRETIVQIVGYVGAAGALAGAAITIAKRENLSEVALAVFLGIVAAVLLAAGVAIGSEALDVYRRMRSVFWWASVVAFTEFMGVVAVEGMKLTSPRALALTIEVSAAIYAGLLYGFQRSLLQQLVLFQALAGVIIAISFPDLSNVLFGPPDLTAMAMLLWLFGGAWFFLGATGRLQPRRTAMVLGSIALLSSPFLLIRNENVAEILALASAAVLLWIGDRLADRAIAGIAVVGVNIATLIIVGHNFRSSNTESISALAIGLVLLAGALVAIRTSPPAEPPIPQAPPMPPPVPPDPQSASEP